MTLADVGSTAQGLSKRVAEALGLNDTLGGSLVFALQASLTSLAALWLAMWLQLRSRRYSAPSSNDLKNSCIRRENCASPRCSTTRS